MEQKEGKLFKNEMFGFCKEDVVKYIEQYSKQNEQTVLKLKAYIGGLEEQIKQKDDIIKKLNEEYSGKLNECEELKQKNAEIKDENDDLKCKISLYEQELEKYKEVKLKLADIEVDAYKRAEETGNKANEQAKEIISNGIAQMKELSGAMMPAFANIKDKIKDAEQSLAELKYKLNKIAPETLKVPDDVLNQALATVKEDNKTAEEMCREINEFVKKLKSKQQNYGVN